MTVAAKAVSTETPRRLSMGMQLASKVPRPKGIGPIVAPTEAITKLTKTIQKSTVSPPPEMQANNVSASRRKLPSCNAI
jgi:hypothetical protein